MIFSKNQSVLYHSQLLDKVSEANRYQIAEINPGSISYIDTYCIHHLRFV